MWVNLMLVWKRKFILEDSFTVLELSLLLIVLLFLFQVCFFAFSFCFCFLYVKIAFHFVCVCVCVCEILDEWEPENCASAYICFTCGTLLFLIWILCIYTGPEYLYWRLEIGNCPRKWKWCVCLVLWWKNLCLAELVL
jgi:uncharacterized membrane protein